MVTEITRGRLGWHPQFALAAGSPMHDVLCIDWRARRIRWGG